MQGAVKVLNVLKHCSRIQQSSSVKAHKLWEFLPCQAGTKSAHAPCCSHSVVGRVIFHWDTETNGGQQYLQLLQLFWNSSCNHVFTCFKKQRSLAYLWHFMLAETALQTHENTGTHSDNVICIYWCFLLFGVFLFEAPVSTAVSVSFFSIILLVSHSKTCY